MIIKNLFLDDIRQPRDACYLVTNPRIYWDEGWDVVKNYKEFCNWIKHNGLPKIVSFDHDLADIHYEVDFSDWNDMTADQLGVEETGLDCAKWLVEYCLDSGFSLPEYYVHSANPVGKKNIQMYLDNAKTHIFKKK
jgi:hypothetical protein